MFIRLSMVTKRVAPVPPTLFFISGFFSVLALVYSPTNGRWIDGWINEWLDVDEWANCLIIFDRIDLYIDGKLSGWMGLCLGGLG